MPLSAGPDCQCQPNQRFGYQEEHGRVGGWNDRSARVCRIGPDGGEHGSKKGESGSRQVESTFHISTLALVRPHRNRRCVGVGVIP